MPRLTKEEQSKGAWKPSSAPIAQSTPPMLVPGPMRVDTARTAAVQASRGSYVSSKQLATMGFPGYGGFQVPAGTEVAHVKEVPAGGSATGPKKLEITLTPKPLPLSYGEQGYLGLRLFEEIVLAKMGQQKNPLARTLLEVGPMGEMYFAAGAFGAMESNVYGVANLGSSIVKSVQTRQLQYSPVINVRGSPTTIGAALNPFEAAEMQQRPYTYQAGAMFGEFAFQLGTYYGTKYAVQGVRSVASFAYARSGLKYSHLAYQVS